MPAAGAAPVLVRSLAEIPGTFFDVIRNLPGQPALSVVYAAPAQVPAFSNTVSMQRSTASHSHTWVYGRIVT